MNKVGDEFKQCPSPLDMVCPYCVTPTAFVTVTCDREHYSVYVYRCPKCNEFILVKFDIDFSGKKPYVFKLMDYYPKNQTKQFKYLSRELEEDRLEAWNNYYTSNYKSALIMARATLQKSIRHLGGIGNNLHNEIEDLFSKNIITKDLKVFAHTIRATGNDMAHPSDINREISKNDSKQILNVLDIFLEVTIEIPKLIATEYSR